MAWLFVSIAAYFLLASEKVLDKFLLSSKRISHPAVFVFYSGFLGLFSWIFYPFGFHLVNSEKLFHAFFSGAIFCYGMLLFFYAISKSEASRVAPVLDAIIVVATFFLSMGFLGERLNFGEILGISLLIAGGIWIAYDLTGKKEKILMTGFFYAVFAGILIALATTYFKFLYQTDNFLNVYVWTRTGVMLGALSFFLVPTWRKKILDSFGNFKKTRKAKKGKSGLLFVLAKTFGGAGNILKEKAVSFSLASVTVINALASVEFVFIFVLGILFSLWVPKIYKEKRDRMAIFQKLSAILIITAGIVLVAKYK